MKDKYSVHGRVTSLQKIIGLGVVLTTLSFAAPSAQAITGSKSASVGNSVFGATAIASFSDAVIGDSYRATFSGRVDGKVLTKSLSIASGTSSLQVQRPSKCRAYGSLKLAGITLASWDKSFTSSTSFATGPLFKTLVGGSTRVWVGPVPVTIKAGARAGISAQGSVTVSVSPITGTPIVHGTIGPAVDVAATASAGVSLAFAGVEVNGSLTLIGAGITGDINYAPTIAGCINVTGRASVDVRSTQGAIKVCAWVDPPFVSRSEWCKTVYEYAGGHNSYTFASFSRSINCPVILSRLPVALSPL
jgi:hypothetical protein